MGIVRGLYHYIFSFVIIIVDLIYLIFSSSRSRFVYLLVSMTYSGVRKNVIHFTNINTRGRGTKFCSLFSAKEKQGSGTNGEEFAIISHSGNAYIPPKTNMIPLKKNDKRLEKGLTKSLRKVSIQNKYIYLKRRKYES